MKGIIVDCVTGEHREVELEYIIEKDEGNRKILKLLNGPIGYESFYIDNAKKFEISKRGWAACIGTKSVYDRLFISAEEMKKVLENE